MTNSLSWVRKILKDIYMPTDSRLFCKRTSLIEGSECPEMTGFVRENEFFRFDSIRKFGIVSLGFQFALD